MEKTFHEELLNEEKTYRKWMGETLSEIRVQTTKTNGRVTRLERVVLVLLTILGMLAIFRYPQLIGLLTGILSI